MSLRSQRRHGPSADFKVRNPARCQTVMRAVAVSSIVAQLSGVTATAAGAPTVTDADRKAARDLFLAGVKLQQEGNCKGALDNFERAQRVLSAPTHLLRIAQCEAVVGRLVESAETYRELARFPLASDAPKAFVAAKDQGASELPAIEKRVPSLQIDVTPQDPNGLRVAIDDDEINVALVGVPRPLNPGAHRIAVSALGYRREDRTVNVNEGATKRLAISLTMDAKGTSVASPPATAPAPESIAPPPPAYGNASGTSGSSATGSAEVPAAYTYTPRSTRSSESGLVVGARLGAAIPFGGLSGDVSLREAVGAGPSLALEGGIRFAGQWYIGGLLDIDGLSGKSINNTRDYTAGTGALAAMLGYFTSTDQTSLYVEGGLGYRVLGLSDGKFAAARSLDGVRWASFGGPELVLGAGLHLRAGKMLRLVPKVQTFLGPFSSTDVCNAAQPSACDSFKTDTNPIHAIVVAGLGGYFVTGL